MQDEERSHLDQPTPSLPPQERIGLSIIATDAADAVNRIVEAEQAGLRQIWLSQGGSGGADTLTIAAMAAIRTTQIRLGTAIVPIYPRHPIVMAQQALAIHDLAPGRLRLGIGPSHRPIIQGSYGLPMPSPLSYLQEYSTVLRGLLGQGQVEHHGTFFEIKAASRTAPIPLLVSALGKRAFQVAGEISDGAISWVCPVPYLLNEALPSLQAGAAEQGRPVPPLVAHVVVALSTDEAAVHTQACQFLLRYSKLPFYAQMFASAGLPVAADGTGLEELARVLVISGDEARLRQRLGELLAQGLSELMIHPLPMTNTGKERSQLLQVLANLA
ncbi:MAG TPA: LLM class flavin-dependent oxidoreductase [Ktedonobacteraceae bacterium]|nr:LLM class flavin-dependent oxidoreductase [Ktedonobacteraceae bacterium]